MKKLSKTGIALLCVIVIAAALIVVGVVLGQPTAVWQKASMICYECIGLG